MRVTEGAGRVKGKRRQGRCRQVTGLRRCNTVACKRVREGGRVYEWYEPGKVGVDCRQGDRVETL